MTKTLGQRVRERRKALKLSQTQLADAAGVTQSAVADIERDVTKQPRSIAELAKALRISVEDLLSPSEGGLTILNAQNLVAASASLPSKFRYVRVRGEVSAGLWRAMADEDAFEAFDIPILEDPRYPDGSLFGLVVRGTSIDKEARDGEIAICLDAWSAPRPYQHNDLVVVRRHRNGQIETTIKLVKYRDGALALFTSSNDPRYDNEAPLSLEGDGESDTQIIGFALQFVRLATRL